MARFFSKLSYSLGNEDYRTEQKALRVQPNDTLFCITGSGDRPLHLLLKECRQIVTVDPNPFQNHLLQLKCAALELFDYEHYLAFLGASPDFSRKSSLHMLLDRLDAASYEFWKKNILMVEKGILYQGALERWIKRLSFFIRAIGKEKIDQLFSFEDLEEQREFLRNHWNDRVWKKLFNLALHPLICRFLIKDPRLYLNVDPTLRPGSYICDRMQACLYRCLANQNPLISLCFKGQLSEEAFPPYLTEKGSQTIKNRLNKLSINTADIIDFLESSEENYFDCFSLSDFASYLTPPQFKRLLSAMIRSAKNGARFSIREFLSNHQLEEFTRHFKRDSVLEEDLEQEDNCFVYRYMVGTIEK